MTSSQWLQAQAAMTTVIFEKSLKVAAFGRGQSNSGKTLQLVRAMRHVFYGPC